MKAQLKRLVGYKDDLEHHYDIHVGKGGCFPPFPCGYGPNVILPWSHELDDDWRTFVWEEFYNEHAKWTLMSGPTVPQWFDGLAPLLCRSNNSDLVMATVSQHVPCSFFWAAEKLILSPTRLPSAALIFSEIDGWNLVSYLARVLEEASQLRPCSSEMCSNLARQKEVAANLLHAVLVQNSSSFLLSSLAAKQALLDQQRLTHSAAEIAARQAARAAKIEARRMNNRASPESVARTLARSNASGVTLDSMSARAPDPYPALINGQPDAVKRLVVEYMPDFLRDVFMVPEGTWGKNCRPSFTDLKPDSFVYEGEKLKIRCPFVSEIPGQVRCTELAAQGNNHVSNLSRHMICKHWKLVKRRIEELDGTLTAGNPLPPLTLAPTDQTLLRAQYFRTGSRRLNN